MERHQEPYMNNDNQDNFQMNYDSGMPNNLQYPDKMISFHKEGYYEERFNYQPGDSDLMKYSKEIKEQGNFGVLIERLPMNAEGWFIKKFFKNFGEIMKIEIFSTNYNSPDSNERGCRIFYFDEESVERAVFNTGIRMLDLEISIIDINRSFSEFGQNFKKREYQFNNSYIPKDFGFEKDDVSYDTKRFHSPIYASYYPENNFQIEEDYIPKPKKPKKPFQKVKRSPIIYVGNLNYKTTNKQILDIFSQFGKIIDLRVAYNSGGSVRFLFNFFRGKDLSIYNMKRQIVLKRL